MGAPLDPAAVNAHVAAKMHFGGTAKDPLAAAADICGVRADDGPGPFLSLHARVAGFTAEDLESLTSRGELCRVKAMRGTFFVLPRRLLPDYLGAFSLTPAEAVERLRLHGVAPDEGRRLLADVHDAIPRGGATIADLRGSAGPTATRMVRPPGQTQPKSLLSVALETLALRGLIAVHKDAGFADLLPLEYNTQMREIVRPNRYHRLDRLLPSRIRRTPVARARVAIARHYVRRYGPVRAEDLRTWTEFSQEETLRLLRSLGGLRKVPLGGSAGEFLLDGKERLGPGPEGVTFLPVGDSYTKGYEACDRHLPYRDWYVARYWPTVFVGGELVAVWRYSRMGHSLRVIITPFPQKKALPRQEIEEAARRLAGFLAPTAEASVGWAPELFAKLKPGTARL